MRKKNTKAILFIKDGYLTHVVSNDPNFQYKLIDYDNDPNLTIDDVEWEEPNFISKNIELYTDN